MNPPPSLENLPAHYRLRLSGRARQLRILIHPHGRVEVVIPRGFDLRQLPQLLELKRPWVEQTLKKLGHDPFTLHPVPLQPPETIQLPAVSGEWSVAYRAAAQNRVVERDGRLEVAWCGDQGWRQALRTWLRRQARGYLGRRLDAIAAETGIDYSGVTIRAQRSRWGSCSSRGTINLNQGLLFLEPAEVDYLLLHELCHRIHMNHSRAYWERVARYLPDYRRYDRALRGAMRRLPLWALPD